MIFQNYTLIIFATYIFFLYLKTLTMRLCTLCKIVSMSKQYSGTVGLKTKINLATRYYIIKGSFKGQANRKPSGIFSGTSAASLIYHFLQENLNFEVVGWWRFVFPWFAAQTLHTGRSVEKMTGKKITFLTFPVCFWILIMFCNSNSICSNLLNLNSHFSNFSCRFLNPNNFFQFEF